MSKSSKFPPRPPLPLHFTLKPSEIAAVRHILQRDAELSKAFDEQKALRLAILDDIRSTHSLPANAEVNVTDAVTGAATATLPAAPEAPEAPKSAEAP